METGTDHTIPIHSHLWGRGNTGTVLKDIHMETGTDHIPPIHSICRDVGTRGQYSMIYTYSDRPYYPYTFISIFLYINMYIYVETGCIYWKAIISCSLTWSSCRHSVLIGRFGLRSFRYFAIKKTLKRIWIFDSF